MSAAAFDVFEVERDGSGLIVRSMLTTSHATDLFLGDLTRRGYADRTLTTYRWVLDKLLDRVDETEDVAKITIDDCRRLLNTWNGLSPGTRATRFAVLSSFFGYLYVTEKIKRNPLERLERPKRIAAEDLDVTTVSSADVRKLLGAAQTWPEKLAIGILVYMGPRRHAAALLRLSDYDRDAGKLRFREKGSKTIWKPVPSELGRLLDTAIALGQIEEPDGYLIPNEGPLARRGDRDDRVIWRLVKNVGDRAGVNTHVHALRAAFAVFYLEANPGGIESLKELMGHESIITTQGYLRKLNRGTAMESVRTLDWGVAVSGDDELFESLQIPVKRFAASQAMGAGGFEPPLGESPGVERPGIEQTLNLHPSEPA